PRRRSLGGTQREPARRTGVGRGAATRDCGTSGVTDNVAGHTTSRSGIDASGRRRLIGSPAMSTIEEHPPPHIDEHSVEIAAGPATAWEALLGVVEGSFGSTTAARVARLLGCVDVDASGPRPLTA